MRRLGLLLVLLLAYTLPAAPAMAGGWATVELDSAPDCLSAGKAWRVQLIVKQHGRTPLDDARPTIRISDGEGTVRTFAARHTGRAGTYAATVTYPRAGTWRTRIFDGWADAWPHRLAPVEVAARGAAAACAGDKSTVAATTLPDGGGPAPTSGAPAPWQPSAAVAPPPADDGLPWPQIVAIGLVALLWAIAWLALTGRPRVPRRLRRRTPQRYVPAG
jgi:hypothetical protein